MKALKYVRATTPLKNLHKGKEKGRECEDLTACRLHKKTLLLHSLGGSGGHKLACHGWSPKEMMGRNLRKSIKHKI